MVSPKIWLQLPAVVCTILGLIATFIALATPSWQVVYARELQQWLESGLWMTCKTRPSGIYVCSYAYSSRRPDYHMSSNVVDNLGADEYYSWQPKLLYVFLAVQLFAILCLVSYFFSHIVSHERVACVFYSTFSALSAFICCGALIAFSIFSHMLEYRLYTVSVSGIYEKHHGYSFYIAVTGFIFYFLSLLLSTVYAIYVLRKSRSNQRSDFVAKHEPYSPYAGSQLSSEDYFAMRSLPEIPRNQPFFTSYNR